MKVFESGASSSEGAPEYRLIPKEGLRRLAIRYGLGAAKHGEMNWKKGLNDADYLKDRTNHMIEHLWEYLEHGNSKDDNLAAIAWAAFALMEAESAKAEANSKV